MLIKCNSLAILDRYVPTSGIPLHYIAWRMFHIMKRVVNTKSRATGTELQGRFHLPIKRCRGKLFQTVLFLVKIKLVSNSRLRQFGWIKIWIKRIQLFALFDTLFYSFRSRQLIVFLHFGEYVELSYVHQIQLLTQNREKEIVYAQEDSSIIGIIHALKRDIYIRGVRCIGSRFTSSSTNRQTSFLELVSLASHITFVSLIFLGSRHRYAHFQQNRRRNSSEGVSGTI